jgi:hypothetical protein
VKSTSGTFINWIGGYSLFMKERIRLLSLVDIFEPLSEEEIEHLNGQLPDRHLEKGECFYGPDDNSERLFILQKGKVRIYIGRPPRGGSSPSQWWRPGRSSGRWL